MARLKLTLLLSVLILAAAALLSLNGCGGGTPGGGGGGGSGQIKHVVIIFQENRSVDNLFQDPVLISRGADIQNWGMTSTGQKVTLQPVPLADAWDMGHSHHDFLVSWDNGNMDGFDQDTVFCPPDNPNCAPANPEYYYVQASDVQPYFTLAESYTFGDHMFQTNQGPSFPAHQYIISGTSALTEKSIYDIADNPTSGDGGYGCVAPAGSVVRIINTQTGDDTQTAYPCTEHPALTDLLDKANLSWKYYGPQPGSIWMGPDAILHMCGPNPGGTQCVGSEWTQHVDIQGQNNDILNDISNGQLATVSWVIPNGKSSDHPKINDGSGPSWVAAIVNAIGNSKYWADTAIIITWDDWGGWYDHVRPPTIFNSYEIGFRVPLIVVSPYAKAQYISHVNHDFGSILKFIETTFALGEVDPNVHYADARSDDLSDCFDFNQNPLPFKQVAAPLSADHFLNNTGAPDPPDDD